MGIYFKCVFNIFITSFQLITAFYFIVMVIYNQNIIGTTSKYNSTSLGCFTTA